MRLVLDAGNHREGMETSLQRPHDTSLGRGLPLERREEHNRIGTWIVSMVEFELPDVARRLPHVNCFPKLGMYNGLQ